MRLKEREAVRALLVRPVAFHPALARVCGSVNAGLMLSQAVYWTERTPEDGGWFYKTDVEWTAETYLTKQEQRTARGLLRKLGFWFEAQRGMPRRVFYRVDLDRLADAIADHAAGAEPVGCQQPTVGCSQPTVGCQQPTGGCLQPTVGCQQPGSTESTSESTSEIKVVEIPRARELQLEPEPVQPIGFTCWPLANGSTFTVTSVQVKRWELLYPGVNVEQEVLRMTGWLEASPKNRKTKDGILKFAANWLARAQNDPRFATVRDGRPGPARASPAFKVRTQADYVGDAKLQPDGSYRL
jgi:hypothetical protein